MAYPNQELVRKLNPAPLTEDQIRMEFELTKHDLVKEAPEFMDYRRRVDRTSGLDADLNHRFEYREMRVNHLLEELFKKMGQLGITGVEDEAIAA